jgi:hypothetical protein
VKLLAKKSDGTYLPVIQFIRIKSVKHINNVLAYLSNRITHWEVWISVFSRVFSKYHHVSKFSVENPNFRYEHLLFDRDIKITNKPTKVCLAELKQRLKGIQELVSRVK